MSITRTTCPGSAAAEQQRVAIPQGSRHHHLRNQDNGYCPKGSSASFTRPADTTAYASGDLVANSTTVGSVVPLTFARVTKGSGQSSQIRRIGITKTGTSITNTTVRVHLFSVLPTLATNGDNGAITIATGAAGYLGQVDVVINQAFTDGATPAGWPVK
jgi:hypothetical protein